MHRPTWDAGSRRTARQSWRRSWHGPGAAVGLGLLAVAYWGTIGLITAGRQARRPDAQAADAQAEPPRHWRNQWRFYHRPPRLLPGDRLGLEPIWAPYGPRPIGLACKPGRSLLVPYLSR
jgi:hypothetical protein